MKRDVWCSIVYRWQVQKKAERGVSEKKKKKPRRVGTFLASVIHSDHLHFSKLVCVCSVFRPSHLLLTKYKSGPVF